MKYYTMEHRGSLKDALETRKEITEEKFNELKKYYDYYCYDTRLNCERYKIKDFNFYDAYLDKKLTYLFTLPYWLLFERN